MPSGPDKPFLEGLYQAMRGKAEGMAQRFQPGYGGTELDGDELEAVWNRRAMPLEAEWELWRATNEDGTPMYTREDIGRMVFPEREALAKKGGRIEPNETVGWINATAKRMASRRAARAQQMSPLVPIDPMEGV